MENERDLANSAKFSGISRILKNSSEFYENQRSLAEFSRSSSEFYENRRSLAEFSRIHSESLGNLS